MTTATATIFEQLGGGRFIAFTGATGFVADNSDNPRLWFRIPTVRHQCEAKGTNKIMITLTSEDLYTVSCYAVNAKLGTAKILAERQHVYADGLQSTFTELTGLYTKF